MEGDEREQYIFSLTRSIDLFKMALFLSNAANQLRLGLPVWVQLLGFV